MDFDWSELSRKNGVRIATGFQVSLKTVAAAVTELVGPKSVKSTGRMGGAVVVFVDDVAKVHLLIEHGVTIDGTWVEVSPLSTPAKRVTLSNVPPFMTEEALSLALNPLWESCRAYYPDQVWF